jgi:hypothetical protein
MTTAAPQAGGASPPGHKPGNRAPVPWRALSAVAGVGGSEAVTAYLRPDLVLAVILAPVAIVVIVLAVILLGSDQRVDRLFRLLRWVANRPEPSAPPGTGTPQPRRPRLPRWRGRSEEMSALLIGRPAPASRREEAAVDIGAEPGAAHAQVGLICSWKLDANRTGCDLTSHADDSARQSRGGRHVVSRPPGRVL